MLSPFTSKIVNVYNFFGNLSFYDSLFREDLYDNGTRTVYLWVVSTVDVK